MMKKIKNFFSNTMILVLLLVLGVALTLFLSNRSQNSQPAAQTAEIVVTPTSPTAEKATPIPAVTATATSVPATQSAEPPKDDTPEPTWTPAIIFPKEPPPPLPSPPPTPTATPINPNESVLISFDVPASLGAISPDGKTLAFNRWQVETKGNPYNQVWLLDLASKQTTKLVEVGTVSTDQTWSPDGKKLVYQGFSPNGLEEVGIVGIDGKDAHSLLKSEDLLGYYWIDSQQIGLIRTNSIERVDLTGRAKEKRTVKLPTGHPGPTNFRPKPKAAGFAQSIVVVEEGNLRIISLDGQEITIRPESNEQIREFVMSPNGEQIAYDASQDTGTAFWVSDLRGTNRRKLFERVGENRGHMTNWVWTPDGQAIVLGWSKTGTSQYPILVWIDVKSGQVTPLKVDNVSHETPIFSPNGKTLYYSRTTDSVDDPPWGKTTFYQLRVK